MLKLHKALVDDFDFYYKLKCERSSIYWSGFSQGPDHNNLLRFWEETINGSIGNRRIYILFNDVVPIGYIQVLTDGLELGLSMGVIENERGKGYGREIIKLALMELGLENEYYCYIREDNISSIKSFEANGFKKTDNIYMQNFAFDNKEYKMIKFVKRPKLIAVIPARSGSRGLKDKNIKELNGKPLLAYSIESAVASEIFDTVHVSTDSRKYAEIAEIYGAEVPFLRDAQNSGDSASSWDAVREVLRKYGQIGKHYDICVLLQPTSPLRTADDIRAAYELFKGKEADSLTSVTEVEHPVQWCFKLDDSYSMKDFASSPYKACRRQELEKYYRENGAIYIVNTSNIVDPAFDFYSERCVAYIMDRRKSVDIDTLQDLILAETILTARLEEDDE